MLTFSTKEKGGLWYVEAFCDYTEKSYIVELHDPAGHVCDALVFMSESSAADAAYALGCSTPKSGKEVFG